MKLETLVNRYKNLGYKPKGLERDLEIESIIKWLYETHDIYINVQYCSMKFDFYKQFTGQKINITKKEYNNTFFCDKHFDNPFDAKFDAVRCAYRPLKFQKY